jgi:hypothetical protein
MIVLVTGAIADPDVLTPYLEAEIRIVGELKAEGVLKALYRRTAESASYLILEGSSIDGVANQINRLRFVSEGLMTVEYEEIQEL